MRTARLLLLATVVTMAGCGGSNADSETPSAPAARPQSTVFDPMTSTIERAEGVQRTVDEQAAEQRRRIEAAER